MNGHGSHIEILRCLWEYDKIRTVLEFGSGLYSTPAFMAHADELTSIDLSQAWLDKADAACVTRKAKWTRFCVSSEFEAFTTRPRKRRRKMLSRGLERIIERVDSSAPVGGTVVVSKEEYQDCVHDIEPVSRFVNYDCEKLGIPSLLVSGRSIVVRDDVLVALLRDLKERKCASH